MKAKLPCSPEEIALKSFFLGPQAENGAWFKMEIGRIVDAYLNWRAQCFPNDGAAISAFDQTLPEFKERRHLFHAKLSHLVALLEAETPKFTPRYMGHMVSEVSLPALLGHFVTLLHNPNNASKEVSRMTSVIENEAIASLARMVGYGEEARGHFTSGGTIANFEALYRARAFVDENLAVNAMNVGAHSSESLFEAAHRRRASFASHPDARTLSVVRDNPFAAAEKLSEIYGVKYRGPVVLVPGNKHYSWEKAVSLLGLGSESFWSIPLDASGRMDLKGLEDQIGKARQENRPIAMVVSVAGTTELGEFDALDRVQDLLDRYLQKEGIEIWHHVDAAYGGFYASLVSDRKASLALPPAVNDALLALRRVDSVTIDPHKLGYVPYSCGAFLAKDESRYRTQTTFAPYLEGAGKEGNWQFTLEGSRPGSGAVATWMTAQCIGFNKQGYGKILEKGVSAVKKMARVLEEVVLDIRLTPTHDSNVLCFTMARTGESLSKANARILALYDRLYQGDEFAVSKTTLYQKDYGLLMERMVDSWDGERDTESMQLIRMVLMNPFTTSQELRIDLCRHFAETLLKSATGNWL